MSTGSGGSGGSGQGQGQGQPPPPMPYDNDKMPFYALGMNLGMQIGGNIQSLLNENELEIALDAFCQHLRGTAPVDARAVLTTYGPQLNEILNQRSSQMTDRIKAAGREFKQNFLDCNPGNDTVETPSGLVYCEMKAGTGKQPTLQSTVEVHYHGTLTDGTVFDSSVERGQTISFPLSGVIKGWQEGLQLMKEGGKATLIIPSDLAYGDAGSGETIPPGSTLRFEVELFKVQ